MAILRVVNPIESVVMNPKSTPAKYTWGTKDNSKLLLAPHSMRRFPYDVFTESDQCGRAALTYDLAQGNVVLSYVTHGVSCMREDVPVQVTAPVAATAPVKETPSDVKAAQPPAIAQVEPNNPGASKNTALADEYDAIGRTGSIESAKPERVSPMDEAPVTRDDHQQLRLDDWDGSLEKEAAAVEASQPSPDIPEDMKEVAAQRARKSAKKGRR